MNIEIIPEKKEYHQFLELYPPKLSSHFLPEWWKSTKAQKNARHQQFKHEGNPQEEAPISIKKCPAIQDALQEGIILPLWGNLDYYKYVDKQTKNEEIRWDFSGRYINNEDIDTHIQFHTKDQLSNMPISLVGSERILKLKCPYKFIVPKGYNIYYTDPFYHFRKSIKLLSGVVEADKWGYITFPFEVLEDDFRIEAGEPLVQLFVYKREEEKINLTLREGSDLEYEQVLKEHRKLFITGKNYKS